jgi:hypothetical protein
MQSRLADHLVSVFEGGIWIAPQAFRQAAQITALCRFKRKQPCRRFAENQLVCQTPSGVELSNLELQPSS